MKKVKVEHAVGMKLCHDITGIREGFKGRAYSNGHIIRESDIPILLDLGKKHVFVWEENAGEIHEDDAARRLAALAPVEGAEYSGPSEGKMVLTAKIKGLFRVNEALLTSINTIGDITITTIPDHYPAVNGQKLASMRIVPLVTKEEQIIKAEKLCADSPMPLLGLIPYRKLKAGIIVTGSEVYSGRIKDIFEPVIREKLEAFDADIIGCAICDDDQAMIENAIREHLSRGAELIVLTGGMSVDPDDLTPAAIRNAGTDVITQGVPAQPGNMFMLGYIGGCTVLGVPGAAISMKTTVLDIVLPQVFTGEPFTKADFIRIGMGGLCQSCGECHYPNCTYGRY